MKSLFAYILVAVVIAGSALAINEIGLVSRPQSALSFVNPDVPGAEKLKPGLQDIDKFIRGSGQPKEFEQLVASVLDLDRLIAASPDLEPAFQKSLRSNPDALKALSNQAQKGSSTVVTIRAPQMDTPVKGISYIYINDTQTNLIQAIREAHSFANDMSKATAIGRFDGVYLLHNPTHGWLLDNLELAQQFVHQYLARDKGYMALAAFFPKDSWPFNQEVPKMTSAIKIHLHDGPQKIMVIGMGQGAFMGKSVSEYFTRKTLVYPFSVIAAGAPFIDIETLDAHIVSENDTRLQWLKSNFPGGSKIEGPYDKAEGVMGYIIRSTRKVYEDRLQKL